VGEGVGVGVAGLSASTTTTVPAAEGSVRLWYENAPDQSDGTVQ
jgi:hypothetical protein